MSSPPEGHLSESQVATILDAAQGAGAILIGGQSVAVWGRRYRAKYEAIRKFDPLTSADVDFHADGTKAQIIASRLQEATIYFPKPFDDATPNSAKIAATIGTHRIVIDFMSQIVWVKNKNIEDRYLTLAGAHPDTGEELRFLCLHPLDCLANRLGNINVLRRNDEQALRSAGAAIVILDAFIDELLEIGWTKEAQDNLVELEFIIKNKCAKHPSFTTYGLNPTYILGKYAEDERLDIRFRERTLSGVIERSKGYLAKGLSNASKDNSQE
jgi:hypothetical protein